MPDLNVRRVPMALPAAPLVLTVAEAAAYLRVGRSTLYQLFGNGTIARYKVGRRVFVRQADLDGLLGISQAPYELADTFPNS
jgi:excisionase family DNA binding protein